MPANQALIEKHNTLAAVWENPKDHDYDAL